MSRETKSKESTQKKIDDINEKVLAIEKSVGQFENENKSVIKSEFEKQKTYVDTSSDNMIKMNEAEGAKMRARLSQFSDDIQTLEGSMAELRQEEYKIDLFYRDQCLAQSVAQKFFGLHFGSKMCGTMSI